MKLCGGRDGNVTERLGHGGGDRVEKGEGRRRNGVREGEGRRRELDSEGLDGLGSKMGASHHFTDWKRAKIVNLILRAAKQVVFWTSFQFGSIQGNQTGPKRITRAPRILAPPPFIDHLKEGLTCQQLSHWFCNRIRTRVDMSPTQFNMTCKN